MTPAELVLVSMMLLIFVRDLGEQYHLDKEGWYIWVLTTLMGAVLMGLIGTIKGLL